MKYAILLLISLFLLRCSSPDNHLLTAPGISQELATHRAERISELQYDLFFDIPLEQEAPIPASVTLEFDLSSAKSRSS